MSLTASLLVENRFTTVNVQRTSCVCFEDYF